MTRPTMYASLTFLLLMQSFAVVASENSGQGDRDFPFRCRSTNAIRTFSVSKSTASETGYSAVLNLRNGNTATINVTVTPTEDPGYFRVTNRADGQPLIGHVFDADLTAAPEQKSFAHYHYSVLGLGDDGGYYLSTCESTNDK